MTPRGTHAYEAEPDVPGLVRRAVELARSMGFDNSCLPAQGRLLQVLVRGRPGGVVGETGTGCGVGLAWMVAAADPATTIFSVERDPDRYRPAVDLFAGCPNVTVLLGQWPVLLDHGPFDLLVLDGGGSGKVPGDDPVRPNLALAAGGTLVIDDLSPRHGWPPLWQGSPDTARAHWLEHPELLSTEVRVAPHMVSIVATRR